VKVEFHPAADSELRAAAKYYNDRVSGLGAEFLAEVEKACLRLGEHQALGPRLDADHRRLALRRFPFGLIYRLRSSKGSDRRCCPSPQAAGILGAAKVMCRECDELRLGVP
jgi:hypothetical protein